MVGLDHQTAADRKMVRGLRECVGEFVQFAVDFDAQRLEHPFRRIASRAVRFGHDMVDETVQLAGCRQRLLPTFLHDGVGDLTSETLLAVRFEDVDQIALIVLRKHLGRGEILRDVHTHVQRSVMGIREAAIRLVNLQAGKPQIHENRLNRVHAEIVEDLAEFIERRMNRSEPVVQTFLAHPLCGERQRFAVTVDADQTGFGSGFEEGARVACQAQGAIDDNTAGTCERRGDKSHTLLEQNRLVDLGEICHR